MPANRKNGIENFGPNTQITTRIIIYLFVFVIWKLQYFKIYTINFVQTFIWLITAWNLRVLISISNSLKNLILILWSKLFSIGICNLRQWYPTKISETPDKEDDFISVIWNSFLTYLKHKVIRNIKDYLIRRKIK